MHVTKVKKRHLNNILIMRTKYFKWVIGSIILLFSSLVTCCSDKNNKEDISIQIYNGKPSDDNELKTNDTISMLLLSKCTLYFNSSSDSLFVISDNDKMELECIDHNIYRCTPKCIGKTSVAIIPFDSETDNSIRYVHFNIKSYSDTYNIIKNTYSINVPSNIMEYTIIDDIESTYMPIKLSTLRFQYATPQKGDFSYKTAYNNDSIAGTFVVNGSEYEISYGKVSQSISIEEEVEGRFTLTQDFTEAFQNKYPSSGIEQVILTSTATGYKH